MKRVCLSASASLAFAALIACGGKSTESPTAPSLPATPGPAVSAVIVTNAAVSETTMQMIATARFADGATRDVTTSSAWESSNSSVATISPSGLLTILTNGQVEARANYQGVTGAVSLTLTRPPAAGTRFSLSGLSREVSPQPRIIGGARITITDGPDAGMTVTSDAGGQFRFASVTTGRVSLEATRDGYQLWRMTNLMVDGNKQIEVVMYPNPPVNAAGQTATGRCNDSSWTWETSVLNACSAHGGLAYGVCPGAMCGAPLKPEGVR